MISYDDFQKIQLRAAKIITAERVEGSAKLLKLEVDAGADSSANSERFTRQIVAGIGKRYAPEALVGKYIVIVANLAPREFMGIESHGMLLAAGGADGPVLLIPDGEVSPGAVIG